jgi:hypothetical protein
MQTYTELMNAVAILRNARKQHSIDAPAWDFVNHAINYLTRQAETAMRGEA